MPRRTWFLAESEDVLADRLPVRRPGRQVAVVSNNSTAAVETYLETHDLREPLIKPGPFLVSEAVIGTRDRFASLRAYWTPYQHPCRACRSTGILIGPRVQRIDRSGHPGYIKS